MDSSKTAGSICKREKGENAFWGEQVASGRDVCLVVMQKYVHENIGSSSYLHLREEREGICSWD